MNVGTESIDKFPVQMHFTIKKIGTKSVGSNAVIRGLLRTYKLIHLQAPIVRNPLWVKLATLRKPLPSRQLLSMVMRCCWEVWRRRRRKKRGRDSGTTQSSFMR